MASVSPNTGGSLHGRYNRRCNRRSGHTQPTRPSRLNQALAWVGIVAGGLFVVGAIFFAGYFLNWSEHTHMQMGHAAMSHEQKDCCADMKPGDDEAR